MANPYPGGVTMDKEPTRRMGRTGRLGSLLGGLACLGMAAMAGAEHPVATNRPEVDVALPAYAQQGRVAGNFVIAGSDTMQPLVLKLALAFKQRYPEAKIGVLGGGTEKALLQFTSDQAQIRRGDGYYQGPQASGKVAMLASSRRLTDEERASFRSRHGYDPVEVPIALDAVAVYVNKDNPIQGLTLEQVDAIFGRDRRRGGGRAPTTWGEVGVPLWAQQPIHLYGRDKQSGTRSFFKEEALLGGEFRDEVVEQPGSASLVLAISKDPLGIGYAGVGFHTSFVRMVPLAEKPGQPYVVPSAESTAKGSYPLRRTLYLYANLSPGDRQDPEEVEFLKFINSREGQEVVVKAGVYPLPAVEVAKNLQRLQVAVGQNGPAGPVASAQR
jgi:phosphate transport system substrate-binding protein